MATSQFQKTSSRRNNFFEANTFNQDSLHESTAFIDPLTMLVTGFAGHVTRSDFFCAYTMIFLNNFSIKKFSNKQITKQTELNCHSSNLNVFPKSKGIFQQSPCGQNTQFSNYEKISKIRQDTFTVFKILYSVPRSNLMSLMKALVKLRTNFLRWVLGCSTFQLWQVFVYNRKVKIFHFCI